MILDRSHWMTAYFSQRSLPTYHAIQSYEIFSTLGFVLMYPLQVVSATKHRIYQFQHYTLYSYNVFGTYMEHIQSVHMHLPEKTPRL